MTCLFIFFFFAAYINGKCEESSWEMLTTRQMNLRFTNKISSARKKVKMIQLEDVDKS